MQPIIMQLGRYFEITRAVVPDLVTVIMALAFRSWAEVTVAWLMALVMSVWVPHSRLRKRLS